MPTMCYPIALAQACPRCGAQTRSGGRCLGMGMANGRCRMHGGCLTGTARRARARSIRSCEGQGACENRCDHACHRCAHAVSMFVPRHVTRPVAAEVAFGWVVDI